MIDFYKEEITINLTREESIQILDTLAEMIRFVYDPRQIINIHHKIFSQVFDEVTLEFKGGSNAK